MRKILFVLLLMLEVSMAVQAQTIKEGFKVKTLGTYTITGYGNSSHDQFGSGQVGFGYQFNKYIYAGAAIGVAGPVDTSFDDPEWIAPMMADVQLSLPWCRFTPLCEIAFGGSAISFGNDSFKDSKYLLVDFLPGLSFRMNDWLSLQGNLGYEYKNVMKGLGKDSGGFSARFGLVFDLLK